MVLLLLALSSSGCWVAAVWLDRQTGATEKMDCVAAEKSCANVPGYHCYVAGLCWEEERGGRKRDLARAAADFSRGCDGGAEQGCVSLAHVLEKNPAVAGEGGPARARAALLRACRINFGYCAYVAEAADEGKPALGIARDPALALFAHRRVCWATGRQSCKRAVALQAELTALSTPTPVPVP